MVLWLFLNFKLNTLKRVRKAILAPYTCKRAIGKIWDLKVRVVRWLYTTIVRLIKLYGNIVWSTTLQKPTSSTQYILGYKESRNYALEHWLVDNSLKTKLLSSILTRLQRISRLSEELTTAPKDVLNVIIYILPLDIVAQQHVSARTIRLWELSLWSNNIFGHCLELLLIL